MSTIGERLRALKKLKKVKKVRIKYPYDKWKAEEKAKAKLILDEKLKARAKVREETIRLFEEKKLAREKKAWKKLKLAKKKRAKRESKGISERDAKYKMNRVIKALDDYVELMAS